VKREARDTYSSEHLLAVKLLSSVKRIVDEGEARGSATSELGLQTENGNVLLLDLEGLGQLALDVTLGDVSLLGVDQLNHLLFTVSMVFRYLRIVFSGEGDSSRICERKE
jgi:hypothetical protein